MASFVAEVLSSAGQLETHEVSTKLEELSNKIYSLKLVVHNVTVSKYSNSSSQLHNIEQLVSDVQGIKIEMNEMEDRIENQIKSQLNMSTGEFQTLSSKLEEVNTLLVVLEKLANLQDGLETVKTAVEEHEYSKAADSIHQVEALLAQKVYEYEDEVSILTAIKEEVRIQMEQLKFELHDRWKTMLQWTIPSEKDRQRVMGSDEPPETLKTELKINTELNKVNILERLVIGMKKMDVLRDCMKRFSDMLLTHVLTPLTKHGKCMVEVTESGPSKVLTIEVRKTIPGEEDSNPDPQEMFHNLSKVLSFLDQHLLHVVIKESSGDGQSVSTLMNLLGEFVADETLDLAVKQCLIKAIPSSHKDLEQFNTVLVITKEVHKRLVNVKFIQSDNSILTDYIQNVNTLFANKKCQEITEKARSLMTVEVHNTVKVSHDKPLGELPPLFDGEGGGGKKARKADLAADIPLSTNTFRLPSCLISTSVQELVTMAYETLQEASESSSQCAIQLFCAVRSMFELFCTVFPTYHKQKLETLPQFSALHYNNCMYISHHLLTLGHQFSKQLPDTINPTFVDLVPKIRRLGTDSFLQQLYKQKAQMSEYLEAANGFLSVSEDKTFLATEKAIKQVLHQLHHLKKVWRDVLPPSNFRKAMGGLVNSVIVEITDSIVALEDISADDAKQLSRVLTTIADKTPELFEVPEDSEGNLSVVIQRSVPKWQRFRELDMVLNASMIDISDRWAAGKGPLAVVFSADEVKQLIRALFQNTDRRSQMLAKIK